MLGRIAIVRNVQRTALKRSTGCSVLRQFSVQAALFKQPVPPKGRSKTVDDINKCVLNAKYAVRGRIPLLAEALKTQLAENPESLPFSKIINANIGNPQQLDQKPLSFYRQVISLIQNPDILNQLSPAELSKLYKPDVIERAQRLLKDAGGSVGAYSQSQGVAGYRETVADFIANRDGEPANANDIFLTSGASGSVAHILQLFCSSPENGCLIPIPQYPLYTATLALNNASALPYFLDEESGWSTDPQQIEDVVKDAIKRGVTPTTIVVINPGNPTGAILSAENIEAIFEVAARYGLVVIADEVYQENGFDDVEFISMKKVLRVLQKTQPGAYDNVQLVSLHSISKGVSGECGQRGGYMELVGFSEEVKQVILKLASISLCPVVTGQALVDLMVSPPKEGEPSYEQDQKERNAIHEALKERASLLHRAFQSLEGVSCQKPLGAMYLFPKIDLSKKAIAKAGSLGMTPDEYYCKELLEATGICTVPGSGFHQVPGTFHVRTTFLAPGTEWIESWKEFHEKFWDAHRD
ncbi:LAME_0G08768g1_1 [Lachancea meyersii CBS 8951]|uniref:Glutamate pyruvate transaminase n=1 Tax=Lachancea meyersii CBS 8951 TaxID=1266667 RepID=A0A1G4K8C1_9SACH|nr:LAME_0G08768g1_1 [Lachancea meyersii CBS 8951]